MARLPWHSFKAGPDHWRIKHDHGPDSHGLWRHGIGADVFGVVIAGVVNLSVCAVAVLLLTPRIKSPFIWMAVLPAINFAVAALFMVMLGLTAVEYFFVAGLPMLLTTVVVIRSAVTVQAGN